MKRKAIIAVLMAAVMTLSTIGVFALDYPAQEDAVTVTARFFLVEPDESDNEFAMVSEDGELVIHIVDNTSIYFEDYVPLSDECEGLTKIVREVLFGRTLAEVLDGRNLRVIFEESDQIEPISIIVLFEIAVTLPQDIDLEGIENGYVGIMTLPGEIDLWDGYVDAVTLPEDVDDEEFYWSKHDFPLNGELVVNYEILEEAFAPFWYSAEGGYVVMVPLRAVAEAMGYDVSWNGYLQSIQLGVAIHLWIGGTEVHFGRMAPIEISTAPVLINDTTFVPLDFFRNVLGYVAYVFEGQVVIAEYSDMM